MDKAQYHPESIEEAARQYWQEHDCFRAVEDESREKFYCLSMFPYPSGRLHMGHALNSTLQDVLARWKRMQGFDTLWQPGTDHAGIATQNVVERMLAEEGTSREELGREKFIERVWKWRKESGGTIIHQLRSLGASCDWERERFTMDDGFYKAVQEVFIRLYDEGLVYRGKRLVNWDPNLHTATSDVDVQKKAEKGSTWQLP